MALFVGLAVFVLNIAFSASYPSFDYCDGGSWIRFEGHCYLFESKTQRRVSFYDAEDFCRSQGAHLVSIHSEKENEFLLNTMEQGRFGGRLWIGLNILAGEESPGWSDDSPVDYQKRVPKEFYKGEKCFMMQLSKRGWRPEHCALHYAPICKRPEGVPPTAIPPPTTVPPPVGHCPTGWIQFGQKCYKYFGAAEKDRLQYVQARAACQGLGKQYSLVSVHSMEEQAFLTQHLPDLGASAWIGINRVESDEIGHDTVFGWVDNTRNDFEHWMTGHPPLGTWKYCGRLRYEGVNKGEWIADYCEVSKHGYICQAPADPSLPEPEPEPSECRSGYHGYRNACYRYMGDAKSQRLAEIWCEAERGHLVSIVDGFEQAFLHNFLLNHSRPIGTGLRNVEDSRFLKWTDNQPLYYSNWAQGEPKLVPGQKTCVYLDPEEDFKWRTTPDCDTALAYVCKNTEDEPPRMQDVVGECPAGESSWIDIGDKFCYHVAKVQSWDAVSRYCLARGMQMVSLHFEHDVKSLVAYLWREPWNVHLGLMRTADKKGWMWVDGTPLDYENWADREPSSWSSDKDCVAFTPVDGKWTPVSCAEGGITLCRARKR